MQCLADTSPHKGGSGKGFRPHELLEAALASCMNMSLRMYAEAHDLPWAGTSIEVTLDRSQAGQTIFDYCVRFDPATSPDAQVRLLRVLEHCPVRKTLSGSLAFRDATQAPQTPSET
ncbi:OsmC family protein [Uliginosibacterium gangwonense]|uniref:OsmC family protein n=1 Tax=Uliginosibacterium gangwonense TaxID=392736 RepID=UPI00039D8E4C|nr:OsmC family protein [Uliginosibacterium gangwonense]